MLRTKRLRTLIVTLLLTAGVVVGASGCLLVPVGHDDDYEHHGGHRHGRYDDRYEHHAWHHEDYDRR